MAEQSLSQEPSQALVALDAEGVLTPEVWIAVAERTGIDELRQTTRDEPDYDVLMTSRIDALDAHDIKFSVIADVIAGLEPLPGAKDFLDTLRSRYPVVLLSDTFEQFAQPLMAQLGWPTLLCHTLLIEDDRIAGYKLRIDDQKAQCVRAFQGVNYRVIASGDSYNDLTMLAAANAGILFRAPANVIEENPQLPSCSKYAELLELVDQAA